MPRLREFLLLNVSIMWAFAAVFGRLGIPYVPDIGVSAVEPTVESLWSRGTIASEVFEHDAAIIAEEARRTGTAREQDIFALRRDGKLIQKQSLISAFAALPFYAIFGKPVLLVFQELVTLSCLLALLLLAQSFGVSRPERPLTVVICFLTPLHYGLYSYVTWYDLHGAALIVWGAYLARRRPLLAATVGTLSIFVRPAHFLFIPLWMLLTKGGRSAQAKAAIGSLFALMLYGAWNYVLFGSPFVTVYQRLPAFDPSGQMFLLPHPVGFNIDTFVSGWWEKLLDPVTGWLVYSPFLFVLPFYARRLYSHPERKDLAALAIVSLLYAMYIFSYESWRHSFIGNRFLLPSTFLLAVVFVVAGEPVWRRERGGD